MRVFSNVDKRGIYANKDLLSKFNTFAQASWHSNDGELNEVGKPCLVRIPRVACRDLNYQVYNLWGPDIREMTGREHRLESLKSLEK